MLNGLFGNDSLVGALKAGLTQSTQRARAIADRVANATTPGAKGGFGAALDQASGSGSGSSASASGVDLESQMVSLADEQIRYDATAKLLQKVYAQVRASVSER